MLGILLLLAIVDTLTPQLPEPFQNAQANP